MLAAEFTIKRNSLGGLFGFRTMLF